MKFYLVLGTPCNYEMVPGPPVLGTWQEQEKEVGRSCVTLDRSPGLSRFLALKTRKMTFRVLTASCSKYWPYEEVAWNRWRAWV